MLPDVVSLIQNGGIPFEILLEPPFRNRKIGNVLPPLPMNSWHISDLEISSRSKNCLIRNSFTYLSEVSNLTFRELADIRLFGTGSFDEVISEYISKIGLIDQTAGENRIPESRSLPRHALNERKIELLAVEYILSNIGQREAALVRNKLSEDKIRLSELSETWGISRQRTYQIVDKIQDEVNKNDCFVKLAEQALCNFEIVTLAEIIKTTPEILLGKIYPNISISILDLLIYAGLIIKKDADIVTSPELAHLNTHELLIYAQDAFRKKPGAISPHVKLLAESFTKGDQILINYDEKPEDVMREAEDWADSLK